MGIKHTEEEPIYFGEYDPVSLNRIMNQQKISEHQTNKPQHITLNFNSN